MVSPYVVVTRSLNVTDTAVGVVVHDDEVEVEVEVVGVPGQIVCVAVLYGPVAEVAKHTDGTLLPEDEESQDAGTMEFRRAEAVRRAA